MLTSCLIGGILSTVAGAYLSWPILGDPCEYHFGKELGSIAKHFYTTSLDIHPTPNLLYLTCASIPGIVLGGVFRKKWTERKSNKFLEGTGTNAPDPQN